MYSVTIITGLPANRAQGSGFLKEYIGIQSANPSTSGMCPNLPNPKDNFYILKGSKRCMGKPRLGADKDGKCTIKSRALGREAEL